MFRAVLARLSGFLSGGDEETACEGNDSETAVEGEQETTESGFIPSRLDASVLFAHGMGSYEAEGEIADLEEEAQRLEEQQRQDR